MNIESKTTYENLLVCQAYVKMLQSDLKNKDIEIGKQKTLISEFKNLNASPPERKKIMRKEKAYADLYKKMEEQNKLIKKLRQEYSTLMAKLNRPQ
jgi:hypothetical protein